MSKRKMYEIAVYFDDNTVHILRRKDFEGMGPDGLKLDAIRAIIEFGKTLADRLEEAEG